MNEGEFEQDLETVRERMKDFLANNLVSSKVASQIVLAAISLHLEAKELRTCCDDNHRRLMVAEFGRHKQVLENILSQQANQTQQPNQN